MIIVDFVKKSLSKCRPVIKYTICTYDVTTKFELNV